MLFYLAAVSLSLTAELDRAALLYGISISVFMSFSGFFLLYHTRGQPPGMFIKLVLGGMAVRLLLALGAIAAGIGLFELPATELVGSCFISYLVLTVIEFTYLLPYLTGKATDRPDHD